MEEQVTVTCLCVTRNRVPMLRRAIRCFLNQTYQYRQLAIVYESDDLATKTFLAGTYAKSIYPIEVPAQPRQLLGALRNISLQAGTGLYIAQWDDDDWHAPTRLEHQLRAIRHSDKLGCILTRWIVCDVVSQIAYLSCYRPWEGTILAKREIMPKYPNASKGEDTPVIEKLLMQGRLALLDRPDLYIYMLHDGNTWERTHMEENILRYSTSLGSDTYIEIQKLIARHDY